MIFPVTFNVTAVNLERMEIVWKIREYNFRKKTVYNFFDTNSYTKKILGSLKKAKLVSLAAIQN